MKIKKSILYLALSGLALINFAHAQIESLDFKMAPGRHISYQLIKAKKAQPTFLFLPGVNRGLIADDDALEILSKQGFGVVTMNFSTQPFSVNLLDKNEQAAFEKNSYSLEEFGKEVNALTEELRKNHGIKTIVPVSISFSSAVSSFLSNFPLIIDAVPMTSSAAVNPQLEAYRAMLKAGEIWNPIYGPAITRSMLDQAYYKEWSGQVDAMISTFGLNPRLRSTMIEGYTVGSRASEGFVWDLKKTGAQTRRVFLFAKDDAHSLLKDQLQLFLKALETTPNALAFIVNDAGHVLPAEQPAAYATILSYLGSADIKNVSGIFELQPGETTPKFYPGAEAKKYVKELINSL